MEEVGTLKLGKRQIKALILDHYKTLLKNMNLRVSCNKLTISYYVSDIGHNVIFILKGEGVINETKKINIKYTLTEKDVINIINDLLNDYKIVKYNFNVKHDTFIGNIFKGLELELEKEKNNNLDKPKMKKYKKSGCNIDK